MLPLPALIPTHAFLTRDRAGALKLRLHSALSLVSVLTGLAHAQPHWPQFRGPNGQGVSPDAHPPITFSTSTNLLWRTVVEPGHSSPVIWGNRIFLTSYRTGELSVVAFARDTGNRNWSWKVSAGPVGDVHAASSPAAPSVAADATRAYAYFGSWGLVALDHEGHEVWRRPLTPPRNRYGMATSPILHGGNVILVLDADDTQSRIVAFRQENGVIAWETERPGQRATWSTPALWTAPAQSGGSEALIVLSAQRLSAYQPSDGRELWTLDGFPQETVSVPAIGSDLVFAGAAALGGRGDERYDAMGWKQLLQFDANADGLVSTNEIPDDFRMVLRPDLPRDHSGYAVPFPFKRDFRNRDLNRDGQLDEREWEQSVKNWEASSRPVLMAVRPGPGPTNALERVQWKVSRGLPEMPSFLLLRDRVFYVRDGGLLSCVDASTGRQLYQERVGAAGQYCASPIAADQRLYLASVPGIVTVVDASTDELRVLARNEIGEAIHATPALAGSALYVRTAQHLMAFGVNESKGEPSSTVR
ncbi:MAG: PQQ-binding-like beta-propeller repeat protein [Verrucomicrobiales bacterium]|nr:PQQ-binding-like beta-propeller repeat protein [Verrucomicrobiales bacterium]